jgi:hypothetical protein
VLGPQCVDFATKAIVLSFYVFRFTHLPIVARCKHSAGTRLALRAQPELKTLRRLGEEARALRRQIAAGGDRCEGRPI